MVTYGLKKITRREKGSLSSKLKPVSRKGNKTLFKDPQLEEWELLGELVFSVRKAFPNIGPQNRKRSSQAPENSCHQNRQRPAEENLALR